MEVMSNEIPTDRAQLKALLSNQPPQSAEVIILLLDLKAFVAGAQKVVGKWPYKGANLQDAISLKES